MLFFVEGVAHVLPYLTLDVEFAAVVRSDADDAFLFADGYDSAQRAVYPPFLLVVLDEDDLCAGFHLQFDGGGQRRFGEFTLYDAVEDGGLAVEFCQLLLVGVVHDVAAGCEDDAELGLVGLV